MVTAVPDFAAIILYPATCSSSPPVDCSTSNAGSGSSLMNIEPPEMWTTKKEEHAVRVNGASVDGDDCIKELVERIDPGVVLAAVGLGVEIREFDVKIAVEQARIESQALSIDVISLDVAVQCPGRVAVHLSCRETNVLNMSGKGSR
ncbi:hypothetical protein NC653_022192 [Populus alba x Populus x berolinensis]|uniref:Uncharacterized protein n=1 Tax=Populus alba x Populus x berolinensis TaxID=444605 RepID=A0AAD6QE83_9ROSI|nr:hypothetical protein NC653_021884 [Populus alba x Populus x berolinensis]KAJ6989546.1 hypothetical protein NC653_022192 [Populus alba x Populus x berolinensis]